MRTKLSKSYYICVKIQLTFLTYSKLEKGLTFDNTTFCSCFSEMFFVTALLLYKVMGSRPQRR